MDYKDAFPLVASIVGAGATVYAMNQSRKAQKQTVQQAQSLAAPPSMPTVEPVTPMPVAPTPGSDVKEIAAAKRRSLAEQMARRGRASTVLTNEDSLGG